MPITIASVLSFIPTNIWGMLKKFVRTEPLVTFDTPFKLSTKYTPALLVVLMCFSFGNQFFRNIELDCVSSSGIEMGFGRGDAELNNYCWNTETFLVAKALTPPFRAKVSYPGIWSYSRGEDELVRQRYYKFLWFGFGKMAALAFLPLFFWKFQGGSKVRPLLSLGADLAEEEEAEIRTAHFVETIHFNNGYGLFYYFCKSLATLMPLLLWLYFTGFVGKGYRLYGLDYAAYTVSSGDPWPSPMDALFPKVAKCEWARYGYAGDLEVRSAQCQLPMNNLSQWSFFGLWWWTVVVFLVNLGSHLHFSLMLFCPCLRQGLYRSFVSRVCRAELESARAYGTAPSALIRVNLDFGDWVLLYFLEANLEAYQFRAFIRKLALTANTAIQLRPVQQRLFNQARLLPGAPPPGNQPGPSIGFRDSIINGPRAPPAYASFDLGGPEGAAAENPKMGFTFEKQEEESGSKGGPQNPKMGFTLGEPQVQAGPIVISPPIKVDRRGGAGAGHSRASPTKQRAPKVQKQAQARQPQQHGQYAQAGHYEDEDEGWGQ